MCAEATVINPPLMNPASHGNRAPAARWWELAACQNEDPELFFPIGIGQARARQNEAAKRVCARCPVRAACCDYAIRHPELVGVWGGTSEDERRAEPAWRRQEATCRPNSASARGGDAA